MGARSKLDCESLYRITLYLDQVKRRWNEFDSGGAKTKRVGCGACLGGVAYLNVSSYVFGRHGLKLMVAAYLLVYMVSCCPLVAISSYYSFVFLV